MYRIKYKILALALALIMCASLIGAAFLLDDSSSTSVSADGRNGIKLSEDDTFGTADTSSAFSSDIVDIQPTVTGEHWLIISLDGKSLAERNGDEDLVEYMQTNDGITASKKLQNTQKNFLKDLSDAGIPYEFKYGYTLLTNAVAVKVDVKYADEIAKMNGVSSVDISEYYYAPQDEKVTNDKNAWETGIYEVDKELREVLGEGEGMVAAVLDTGLDSSHPAFAADSVGPADQLLTKEQVQEKIFEGDANQGLVSLDGEATVDDVYYSAKVPFAYDYANKDTDVYPSNSAHGTHVAGIIAGKDLIGQSIEGFTDEKGYLVDIDGNRMENANGEYMTFTGVAPKAQLAICKVFSDKADNGVLGGAEEMDILAALEDCVKLGVDVINMSLGSSAGFSTGDNDNMQRVYDAVRDAGISLVVAASNDYSSAFGGTYGTNLTSNPDSATVGSPSTYPGAISVASINGQLSRYIRVEVGGEDKFLYFSEASDGNNNEKDFVSELISKVSGSIAPTKDEDGNDVYAIPYRIVPGYGMDVNYTKNVNVEGKIAIVQRGGNVSFEDKVRIAQQHGAIGCIIYNNVAGTIRMSVGNISNPIPACSVTMDAVAAFSKTQPSGTLYVSSGYQAGPFMSDFSSWGPTPDLKLKPEISAHGGEIISSVPNGWAEYSGTSMASPNMAGAMALMLSYIERNEYLSNEVSAEDLNHDRVAMANFLYMSTATIAYDQYNTPYSPRKQGAGLADIAKAAKTQAYLYSDGIDKAKIEIGDDPEKTGVYELEFHAKNMGDVPRTYKLDTLTMTESVSSDEITVAEKAYMLDDMATVRYELISGGDSASINGDTLSLKAGSDAKIKVTVTLNDDAKEYIDANFKNGMYVEGFITLTDETTGEKVDLNIPWLGFYGDWYPAPMLDKSQYELDAALADSSIDEDDKPEAAVYPTIPLGSYYNEMYIIPLGSYLYDQDPTARHIYATSDKASISIYDDSTRHTVSQLYGIYAGMLRGAAEVNVSITDAVTGEVVFTKTQKNVRKSFTAGSSSAHGSLVQLDWNAAELGLENNRQYLVHMEGVLDEISEDRPYDPEKYDYAKTFDFNFYIDTEAPEIVDYQVRYVPYEDENEQTQYNVYLDVDVYDNHYSQAIALCFADYSTMTLEMLQSNMTPIYSSRNSTTRVTLDITDYYDQNLELYIQVDDYALNARAYRVDGLKPLEDAVNYPDQVQIVSGDDTSATGVDYSKEITLDVNEVVTLETSVTPSDATSDFLFWHSFNENVVRVQNGTIVGVNPGTALVKVYAGKDEYASSSDGILVTVTENVLTAPRVTSLELGLIKNADNNMVNPTNTTVSVDPNEAFSLQATVEPWYANVEPDIRWKSSVPSVATVDETTGYTRTLAEGTATITGTLYIDGRQTLYTVSTTLSVGPEFVVQDGYLREYHGAGGKVTIPRNLNVYYIYEEAFEDNDNITELEISSPTTEIQQFAFANMKALKRLILPGTIEYVHAYAFYGCENLEEIIIHSRAITFADSCFAGCTSLKSIKGIKLNLKAGEKAEDFEILDLLSDETYKDKYEILDAPNLTSVGARAFYGCTSIEELNLTQLRNADEMAFAGCTSLKKVILSRNTDISDKMFYDCTNLSTLEYTDVTKDDLDSITYSTAESPFYGCNITEIIFPENSGIIVVDDADTARAVVEGGAVYGCDADGNKIRLIKVLQSASSFTVPATVREIAPNAFSGNLGLESVTFEAGSQLETIGNYAFSGTGITSIVIPENVTSIGTGAFSYCENLTTVDLSGFKGTALPTESFANSRRVRNITWNANLASIGNSAFANTALTSLDLTGTAVTTIGNSAFASCPYLATVRLGAITSLGDYAFAAGNSASLTGVTFGEGSDELGNYTFSGQTGLATLNLPESLTSIESLGNGVFYGCLSLSNVPFTALKSVGDYAFYACQSLASLNVSNVEGVGTYAFAGCENFKVSSFDQLVSIGDGAFYLCESITEVVAPKLAIIGASAFVGSGITAITYGTAIPEEFNGSKLDGVTIGKYAFAYTGLTGKNGVLTINANVTDIGDGAFSALENISAFAIDENDTFFVSDGVLYERNANGTYQLMAFPAAKGGEVKLLDSTARVGASAFENATKVTKVTFPYEFKAVGDRAFFNCSATVYEFGCLTAPVLETQPLSASDFDPDDEMYAILDYSGDVSSEKYYANFSNYLALKLYAGKYGITGIKDFGPEGEGLTAKYPGNAAGFTGRIYSVYFSTHETTAVIADDNARAAVAAIENIPTAEQINALTAQNTAEWTAYKQLMSTARNAYNLVSNSQLTFVTNSQNLIDAESAMRAKAATFGENVKIDNIRITTFPTKMNYIRGEKFDSAGMQLTVQWSDGSREVITSGFDIENADRTLNIDDRNIIVRYQGVETSFTVNVSKPAVQSIEFVSYPEEAQYAPGDTYIAAGLRLKVTYVDGITEETTLGYTDSSAPLQYGDNVITITYNGVSNTFTVYLDADGMIHNPGYVPPETGDQPSGGLPTGAIIGIVAGCVVVVAAAAVVAVILIRKKKNS